MKSLYVFIFLFSFTILSQAQKVEVAGIDYTYYPKSSSENGDQKIDYQEMSAFIQYPVVLNKGRDIFMNKLSYGLVVPTLHNPLDGRAKKITESYHAIGYNLSWVHTFNSQWMLVASGGIAIDSDLHEKLSGDDFIAQTLGLLRYTINDKIKIGAGVTYSTTLGRPLWLPVGEFDYKENNLAVSFLFPLKASVMMTSDNKKWRYGVAAMPGGNNFNLGNFISNEGIEVDKVRYSRINFGPLVEYNLTENFTLFASGGVTSNRILEFEVVGGNLATYNTKAGPFFGLGVHYSLGQ